MKQQRKIYCEERLKKGFDKLPLSEIENMCGFIMPFKTKEGTKWEVNTLFKKEGHLVNTHFEAECIANQEMIIGLLLKAQKKR